MVDGWLMWVLPPILGAGIGFGTNWLAIKMLFHPKQPRMGMQGLLPRRQADLASSVGQVVSEELVQLDKVLEPLEKIDLTPHFSALIDQVIESKLGEWKSLPLIGAFLDAKNFQGIRDSVVKELGKKQPEIMAKIREVAMEHIDVGEIARERLASFELDDLERVVNRVAKREFRAIEWWGAFLGFLVGLVQALVFVLLAPH